MVIDMANPFVAAIAEDNETTQELDEFQEYAWDFEHDTFRYDAAGNHIIVTKNEAIKVWIYKGEVLHENKRTERKPRGGKQ